MTRKLLMFAVLLVGSPAFAQGTAKVQVTITIPAKAASFEGRRLVVMLYHNYPGQEDRGMAAVDKHVDTKFSHVQGKETVLKLTLGDKAKLKTNVQYSVNANVFEGTNKITHVSEWKGQPGPYSVLTNGAPKEIAILLRAEK